MDLLFTIGSFLLALGILIAVHEFGHFWVARRLGVRVLRFSIGFGRPLLRWQRHPDATEYVLALFPLGGYVKMLDEREEPVPEDQLALAFNRQALWKRSAIVVAGPLFNLLFAILAYWAIFVAGDTGLKAVVGAVTPQTAAAAAGFQGGDELLQIGDRPVRSWETAAFDLTLKALDGQDLTVRVRDAAGEVHDRYVAGADIAGLVEDPDLLGRLGLQPRRPVLPPVIGEVVPGEPAEQAGLVVGDRILTANGQSLVSWRDWVDLVRERPGQSIGIEVARADGSRVQLAVIPRAAEVDGKTVGRIGAGVRVPADLMADYSVLVRYGPLEALDLALTKTADMSLMMLRVMGRMLIGEASLENLSGPISIAETAGRTASYGLESFVKFLAIVSISLGVLNLLPIPVLDGGHLLYFLIEGLKGGPLSEQFQLHGQQIGFALLAALMSLAFYADIARLLG